MSLTKAQLEVVVEAVDAVVEEDPTRLSRLVDDADALYTWTRDYGRWDVVHLVRPPGEPRDWAIEAVNISGETQLHVTVGMWTREEGRSDLSLEVLLSAHGSGTWAAQLLDLRVL